MLPQYQIACEHEHSNCLLIAHTKVEGEWWMWIDYEQFQELFLAYEESRGSQTFSAQDYMAKNLTWALFGAQERGFDPTYTRYKRRYKTKDISGC